MEICQVLQVTDPIPILGSPFKCEISEGETAEIAPRVLLEAKRATASGDGLKEVVLGAPAFFEIDTNGMDGLVDVKITGVHSKHLIY